MRTCILQQPGKLVIEERPIPIPGKGEIVVKIKSALTCGTDLKAFKRGHPKMPLPTTFGHEASGEVHSVGAGVEKFNPGDAVMFVHTAPCGDCFWCKQNQENLCETIMDRMALGTYAEYYLLPKLVVEKNCFHKPSELSWTEAALLEPLACVCFGLQQIKVQSSDTVVVIGLGAIGLLFIAKLKMLGVEKIIAVGRNQERLTSAAALGAHTFDNSNENFNDLITEKTEGRGADIVIECTGTKHIWEKSIDLVRKGGQVLLFGGLPSGEEVTYNSSRLHYDHVSLISPFHFNPAAVKEAHDTLTMKQIDLSFLISGSVPLGNIEEAFLAVASGSSIKYELKP